MDLNRLAEKEALLTESLRCAGSLIVAYSGGVDSSLIAYYARRTLQDRARIVIAVSPSLAAEELMAAREQAEVFHWDLVEISTNEIENPQYAANDARRCYFCKTALFEALERLAIRDGIKRIAYGANMDDMGDYRPGHQAAREHHVMSPLQDAGLTKEEIRHLARRAGLPSWNRPQAACLASRFPTHVPVTVDRLSQVEKAERYLHQLGFSQVRVRHHDDIARVEIAADELIRLSSNPELMRVVAVQLKKFGYAYVTLDMEGYRQGSTNALAGRTAEVGAAAPGRTGEALEDHE